MLKEEKSLEYVLEVIRVLQKAGGEHDSKSIFKLIESENKLGTISQSYIQKVLPRMVRAGLVNSSVTGYSMARFATEITVGMILDICDMPLPGEPLYNFCSEIKNATSTILITNCYNFNQ